MINDLHEGLRILASQPKAQDGQIAIIRDQFPSVPEDYLELVSEVTELELETSKRKYIRIWGPMGCLEMDEGYGISKRIPGAIPIGDDGGGRVLFFANGRQGFGLYLVGFGDLDIEDAKWIAPSLKALLRESIGVDTF